MNPAEKRSTSRVDWLIRERWHVEESLTTLRASARKLLRARAGLDRIRAIALALRANLKIKDELEKRLADSHCTVQFVYPL